MAMNPFDDQMAEVASTPAPAPALTAPKDPLGAAMAKLADEDKARQTQTMIAGQKVTAPQTPDRAAEVYRLAKQTGIPPAMVDRQFDSIKERATRLNTPYGQMLKESPALTSWLQEDPQHQAVAHDDMDQLGLLEWIVKAPQRAFAQSLAMMRLGELRTKSLYQDLTPDEQIELGVQKYHAELGGKLGAGDSWFRGAITSGSQFLANILLGGYQGQQVGRIGAAAGGAIGAVAGGLTTGGPGALPGAIEGASFGLRAGMVIGGAKFGFDQMAGLAYDEFLGMKDEHGASLDPKVAKAAAFAVGALNAGLQVTGLNILAKTIPGFSKLTGQEATVAVKAALRNPTVRAALGNMVAEYGKTLTKETAVQVGQRATTILGGELAKYLSTGDLAPGQIAKGNINLFNQPKVNNPDGSISTVDSISANIDGKEVLMSRVTPDGRHLTTPEETIAEYRRTGQNLGTFETVDAANRFAEKLHEDYAAGVYDKPSKYLGTKNILDDLIQNAATSAQGMAFTTLPGHVMTLAHEAAQAKAALNNKQFFAALAEGVTNSKLVERLPEAAQDFLAKATKDGPIEKLYAPIAQWNEYWQGKNVDPREMAIHLTGDSEAYDDAVRLNQDLEIPTAAYAVKIAGTEHNAELSQELRLGPEEMNQREAEEFRARQEATGKDVTGPSPEDLIHQDTVTKLVAAGVDPQAASAYADLQAAVFGSLADRSELGQTAEELYRQYGLTVNRTDLQTVGEAVGRPVDTRTAARAESQSREGAVVAPEGAPAGETVPGATSEGVDAPGSATADPETQPAASRAALAPSVPATPADVARGTEEGLGTLTHVPEGATVAPDGEARSNEGAGTVAARTSIGNPDVSAPAVSRRGTELPGGTAEHAAPRGVRPSTSEGQPASTAEGGAPEVARSYRPRFALLLDDARHAGYTGTDSELARQFNAAVSEAETIADDFRQDIADEAQGSRDLLAFIARNGGLGIEAEGGTSEYSKAGSKRLLGKGGYVGELEGLLEGLNTGTGVDKRGRKMARQMRRSGGVEGISGIVVRKGGMTVDQMFESIRESPEFGEKWDNLSDFFASVSDAVAEELGTQKKAGANTFDVEQVLEGALGVKPGVAWWNGGDGLPTGEAATETPILSNLLTDEGVTDQELGAVEQANTFDLSEFDQSLFDQLDENPDVPVDKLTTGELQPRLPGDVGAVRDQEVADAKLDQPDQEFRLTAPAETQAKQRELFQPAQQRRVNVDPDTLEFSEKEQNRLDAVREAFPDDEYWPAVVERQPDGTLRIIDGHNRAVVARERGHQLPVVSVSSREYRSLKKAGFDDIEIAYAALDRAGEGDAARGLDTQFPGANVAERGELASETLDGHKTELFQPAYHGSPFKFEAFSLHAIGSGEGAQAYGWGLYFASQREVAEYYRDAVQDQTYLDQTNAALAKIAKTLDGMPKRNGLYSSEEGKALKSRYDALLEEKLAKNGHIYTAEIPDSEHLLNWDKSASQQSPQVQAALKELGMHWDETDTPPSADLMRAIDRAQQDGITHGDVERQEFNRAYNDAMQSTFYGKVASGKAARARLERWYAEGNHADTLQSYLAPRGEWLYRELGDQLARNAPGVDGPQLASKALASQGVLGIEYRDGVSRSRNAEGSSNFVIFDDKLVNIIEMNQERQPLTNESVEAWAKDLQNKTGSDLPWFDVHLTSRGDIKLDAFAVARGAQRAGLGSRVMEQLVAYADEHGARVVLSPSQAGYGKDVSTPTTSYGRLVDFYKRFGFERNTGRYADMSLSEGMYRDPTVKAGKQGLDLAQDRRGSIRFGNDRQMSIQLFEKADLSTFLHEIGHFYLEVFGDVVDAVKKLDPGALTEKQKGLISDYDALLKHLGADSRDNLSTDQHEQFARLFEAYLMKGEAPSQQLRSSFARFRAWLLGIYGSLKALKVDLSPEVTGIFDRMVATERAIFDAQQEGRVTPMFLTPEAAGMSPKEFGLYSETVAAASRTAREELQTKILGQLQRERTAEWKRQRADVEADVTAEVHERPVYQAIAAITTGLKPDGSPILEGLDEPQPMKLDKQLVGADRAKRLPRGTTAVEGINPAIVADMFGFSSADHLLNAIEQAAPMRDVITHGVDQIMLAEHGNMLLDGSLHEEARAAVANRDRERVVKAELRALGALRRIAKPFVDAGKAALADEQAERAYERRWMDAERKLAVAITKKAGAKQVAELQAEVSNLRRKARGGAATIRAAIPNDDVIRATAQKQIAGTKVRDLRPERFWSTSRKAAQLAIEAAARGNFEGAITLKQQELLSLAAYKEAVNAKDEVEAKVRQVRDQMRGKTRATLGLAGHTYLDQYDGIVDRFSFDKVAQRVLDRKAGLANFIAALEGENIPIDLPEEVLDETRRTNYQDLSVEHFRGVTDALAQILTLAKLKNKLLTAADHRTYTEARDSIVDTIRENKPKLKPQLEYTPADEKVRAVKDWFASHRKISFLAEGMDGYKPGGAVWENIIRPLNAAADRESELSARYGSQLDALFKAHYPGAEFGKLGEKLDIPAIGGSLSKEARLAVALNWGNESSRQRLLNDPVRHWGLEQVQAILKTLDKRDWDFVQGIWDLIDTLWPEIAAKSKRLTGLEPEKVLAAPVQTDYGEYRGGYYSLAYDGRLSARAGQNQAATEAKLAASAAYVNTTTRRGHEKARVANVQQSIRLDLNVITGHLDQVIHDLSLHEALIDVSRLLRDGSITKAIYETHGEIVHKQFVSALQDIALGYMPAKNAMDRAANWMRNRSQIAALAWNFWTAVSQPFGIFQGANEVGWGNMAKGTARFFRDAGSMQSTTTWINEVSPFMRGRAVNASQDLADLRGQLHKPGGWFDGMVRKVTADHLTAGHILDSYLWHIGLAQRIADVPTWLGGYEKALSDHPGDEARAVALADQAVIHAQGHGAMKDLASIQRGGPIARFFLTFYSYGNLVYNQTYNAIGKTNVRSPAQVTRMLAALSMIYVAPSLGQVALSRLMGKTKNDEDEPVWSMARDTARDVVGTALNTMPFVRELGGALQPGNRGYAGPAGTRIIEQAYELLQQGKQGKADEGLIHALENIAGPLFNVPAMQMQRTADGAAALADGRTSNPFALFVGPPPKREE